MSQINTILDTFLHKRQIPHLIFHGRNHNKKIEIVNDFLNKVYYFDLKMKKNNVYSVDCCYSKGIKFIRDDLKLFAKSNVSNNRNGFAFKTIVLYNADYLTVDAQSALRRCIEVFSHTTRFILVVENKYKLLNPILSRFCELYVNDMETHMNWMNNNTFIDKFDEYYTGVMKGKKNTHNDIIKCISYCTHNGICCFHILHWLKQQKIKEDIKQDIYVYFDTIRIDFRCEKTLILQFLNYIFFVQKAV